MHTHIELSDETWLALINTVIPYAANGKARDIRFTDAEANLAESGLDSLDGAVLGAYLCEIFEVPLQLHHDFQPATVRDAMVFLSQHAKRHIHTPEEIVVMLETTTP